MEKLSQKASYAENRRLYYDKVISSYTQGMTIREIASIVPISKSSVQRWIDEYLENECETLPDDVTIPRTPSSVAKTIRVMNDRIHKLEEQLKAAEHKCRQLDAIAKILNGELGEDAILGSEIMVAHAKTLRLSYTIRKTRPHKDGSFIVEIMVPKNGVAAYISTPFSINSLEEWADGAVVNREDAVEINKQMRCLMSFYEELSRQLWGKIDGKSAAETKNMLLALAKQYIAEK